MTTQIPDLLNVDDNNYTITSVTPNDADPKSGAAHGYSFIFSPWSCGLQIFKRDVTSFTTNSACIRGYFSHFKIEEEKLILDKLSVVGDLSNLLPFYGVDPAQHENDLVPCYSDLNYAIDFSGIVVIADRKSQKNLFECQFEKGKLICRKTLESE